MAYTDDAGNSYTASYWLVGSAVIDPLDQIARFRVVGFRDAAARALYPTLQPMATFEVEITPATYNTFFSPALLQANPAFAQVYAALMASPQAAMFGGAVQVQ